MTVSRRLQWLAMALLLPGLLILPLQQLLAVLVLVLGVLTLLKLLEARSVGERRVVALLQLLTAGLLACLQPDLGPSLLQLLATVVTLAGLLALELGEGLSLAAQLRRSLQVLAAALPMALLLFLLAPRLSPFSAMPGSGPGAAVTGLSDTLDPGSIAMLSSNPQPAARVTFPLQGRPAAVEQRYWRVLVHDQTDGSRWYGEPQRSALPPRGSGGAARGGGPDELWQVEPSGLSSVPWSGAGAPLGDELLLRSNGDLRHRGSGRLRRAYALASGVPVPDWQRQPPRATDLLLPRGRNPRLEALGASWAGAGSTPEKLAMAEQWFRSQRFRYTLQPGVLPPQAPLDSFLFERRQGFCGHYASAFTALMRAAGVPARVVSGYMGGTWVQSVGGPSYLDLRQSNAHAWSEVWLPEQGWQRVDASLWLSAGSADPARSALGWQRRTTGLAGTGLWLQRQWWSLDLAWARWWLGFDRQQQEALLQRLLGDRRDWLGPLLLLGMALLLAGALALLQRLQRREGLDGARRALECWLRICARQGLRPQPGESLACFAGRLARLRPEAAEALQRFVALYEQLRFAPARPPQPQRQLERSQLTRGLRREAALLSRQLKRPPS
ncbi:MAG: transglutaminaseTgpA domain-containing protein [Synechococcaceae cyanobacterium]|nr:transglutaminaseTgpA domain-containing protein [Synechococcaceae cyanobacterium]